MLNCLVHINVRYGGSQNCLVHINVRYGGSQNIHTGILFYFRGYTVSDVLAILEDG